MTNSAPTPLAHHFDNLDQQHRAATAGLWAFLATEVLLFGGMFAGYAVYRNWYGETWAAASHKLDLVMGTVNTAVLLVSSFTMALSVQAAEAGQRQKVLRYLATTIVLGAVFLAIKGSEYAHKIETKLLPGPHFHWDGVPADQGPAEIFFSYYFALTGTHAVHMVIGLLILIVLWIRIWRESRFVVNGQSVANMGLYWHFVDVIWVFLFPLLYLIDRSH
ncbi:MAG: cyoC [Schlesneria sp.]|nr:cyoC [Schlesneria sp.]